MASDSGVPAPVVRNCISCGRTIDFSANVCPYCGYDYRAPVMAGLPPVRRSPSPVVGGILVLIAGLLALGNAVAFLSYTAADLENTGVTLPSGTTWDQILGIIRACGAVEVVFGIVAIVGGIFAIQRKHFGLAVAGALLGLFGFGFVVGSLLALIGIILIAVSRKEFR
jgi:hypothetical protein